MSEHIERVAEAIHAAYGFGCWLTPRGRHFVVEIDGEVALRIPVASLDVSIDDIVIEVGCLASARARAFGMMH